MKNILKLSMVLLTTLTMTGCMGALFNRISLTQNRHITIGQELIDLKEAYDKGIISESEYTTTRDNILSVSDQFGALNFNDNKKKEK
ncbi:SHOCT domain-containing protein [Pontiellaceae bacterium B12227]|nr:SHOCT domain-containing protein [Pontiellaceae bacterium B12227]